MKARDMPPQLALALFVLALLMPPAASAASPWDTYVSTWPQHEPELSAEEDCFLYLWNEYRVSKGLAKVSHSPVADREADGRANHLYNYVVNNPYGPPLNGISHDLIEQAPYYVKGIGGELYTSASSPQMALKKWQTSTEGHNEALLSPKTHTDMSIGIARVGGIWISFGGIVAADTTGNTGNAASCTSHENGGEQDRGDRTKRLKPWLQLQRVTSGKWLTLRLLTSPLLAQHERVVSLKVVRQSRLCARRVMGSRSCRWRKFGKSRRWSVRLNRRSRLMRVRSPSQGQQLIVTARTTRFLAGAGTIVSPAFGRLVTGG